MKFALVHGSGVVSKLIKWQTRGNYSHAILVGSDVADIYEAREFIGIRRISTIEMSTGKDPYDLFEVRTTTEQDEAILEFAKSQVGKPYDYVGILRFLDRRPDTNPTGFFCSGFVFRCFQAAGIDLLKNIPYWAVHPADLSYTPLATKL